MFCTACHWGGEVVAWITLKSEERSNDKERHTPPSPSITAPTGDLTVFVLLTAHSTCPVRRLASLPSLRPIIPFFLPASLLKINRALTTCPPARGITFTGTRFTAGLLSSWFSNPWEEGRWRATAEGRLFKFPQGDLTLEPPRGSQGHLPVKSWLLRFLGLAKMLHGLCFTLCRTWTFSL